MNGDDIVITKESFQRREGADYTLTSGSEWFPYGRYLKINKRLFEDAGLVVVQYVPSYEKKSLLEQGPKNGFVLGGRTLFLSDFTYKSGGKKKPSKAYTLHLKLVGDNHGSMPSSNFRTISSREHRKEVFFPLRVQSLAGESIGFYIYPRISETVADTYKDSKTIRFNRFVTAVCMLGSSLVGIDQRDNELSLIKHGLDTALFIDQCITAVEYREGICPYEEMLFMEFGHLLSMASHLAAHDKEKTFLVHLPGFDYLLFAADLVVAGQMTLEAFEQLSYIIIERSVLYKHNLNEIFKGNPLHCSTTLLIESPFENIFGSYNEYSKDAASVYDKIWSYLQDPLSKSGNIKENQRYLVEHCLKQLVTNTKNSHHQAVWQHILSTRDFAKRPSTMEELLRLANAMMLAYGSRGHIQDKTCSMLPITEKQIQVAYDEELDIPKMNAEHAAESDSHYSNLFHITYVDSMTTYRSPSDALELSRTTLEKGTKDATKRGLPFYFNRYGCASDIRTLIRDKNILSVAHGNVGNMQTALTLESVLGSNSVPESRPNDLLPLFSLITNSSVDGQSTPDTGLRTNSSQLTLELVSPFRSASSVSVEGECEEHFLDGSSYNNRAVINKTKSLSHGSGSMYTKEPLLQAFPPSVIFNKPS